MNEEFNAFTLGTFPTFNHVNMNKKQALKVLEEAAELAEATKEHANAFDVSEETFGMIGAEINKIQWIDYTRTRMIDEAADVCQALCNLLAAANVTEDEWADAISRCLERNTERNRY